MRLTGIHISRVYGLLRRVGIPVGVCDRFCIFLFEALVICAIVLFPFSGFAQGLPPGVEAVNIELREVQDAYAVCIGHVLPEFRRGDESQAQYEPGWENCVKVRTRRAELIEQRRSLYDKFVQEKVKNIK